jgi:tRNA nucleotidyltransferase (CCA-adding enzyme)
VRDLLLGQAHLDLDFVVETDTLAVAGGFSRRTGARVTPHEWSRTAVVETPGVRFDLVTARRETYPEPGALPVVTPSTLADDLARRDFTINAMALVLSGPDAGQVVDPHDGRAALRSGELRVLHDASFRDDATRLWRLGRYAARLGFAPETHTETLTHRDRRYLDTISPARILAEIERVLDEREPERAVSLLAGLGVLDATHPALHSPADDAVFRRIRAHQPGDLHSAYLCSLSVDTSAEQIEGLIARIEPERETRRALRALPSARSGLHALTENRARPSQAVSRLEHYPEATLVAMAASAGGEPGRLLDTYLRKWRHVRPALDGNRLIELGVPKGPAIGEALRRLRAARLDGLVTTLDDEIKLVQTEFVNEGGGEG